VTVKKRVHTQVFFWLGLSIFLSMLMAEKVLAKDNWYHFELIVFEQTMPNTETFEGKLAAIKLPRKHFDLTYTTFPKSLLLINPIQFARLNTEDFYYRRFLFAVILSAIAAAEGLPTTHTYGLAAVG